MKYVVAGTAGHIDHGKTTLVRSLTGIDTDRLREEKERGISIDLGFAHLDLTPELRLAFVDVPGHERFIRNMLAGVAGIDLAVLVVAADESIKPQTREHFEICRLIGITRGLVVLTKADLVDRENLDLARMEVEDFIQGSFLEGAPVVAVSCTTGLGLHELRQSLIEVARSVPARASGRYFRLPVDRAFSMRGFGTVATGTLIAGQIGAGQEVELHPSGRLLRVRGLHTHGRTVESAAAGQRIAVNLAAAEVSDLARGMVLAEPRRFRSTSQIDCSVELLAGAKPLKNRAPVHFHSGAAQVEATLRLPAGQTVLAPGKRTYARFSLRAPLLLLPGDRFIIRMFSPVTTIGGGGVLDTAPPRALSAGRLEALATGPLEQRLALLVSESACGLSLAGLVARTGLHESEILAALKPTLHDWFLSPDWIAARRRMAEETLRQFHLANPLLPGMPKEDLRAQVLVGVPAFVMDALGLNSSGDVFHLASHRVVLDARDDGALRKIEEAFRQAGLAVPSVARVLSQSGVESNRAKSLLQILLKQNKLVRISADLVIHATALEALRGRLATKKGLRFAVGDFKDWTGVSRKYAIPLLEFLDRQRITRRDGDSRVVL